MWYVDDEAALNDFLAAHSDRAALLCYADWCPFSAMARIAFEIVDNSPIGIPLAKLRVDIFRGYLRLPLKSIPSLLFCRGGEVYKALNGYRDAEAMASFLNSLFSDLPGSISQSLVGSIAKVPLSPVEFQLEIPHALTAYGSRSVLRLQIKDGSEQGASVKLDRNATNLLLFLACARGIGLQAGLFHFGQLTDNGYKVARVYREKYNLSGARIYGVQPGTSAISSDKYLSKQVSRVNKLTRASGIQLIIRDMDSAGGGYRLNPVVELTVRERP